LGESATRAESAAALALSSWFPPQEARATTPATIAEKNTFFIFVFVKLLQRHKCKKNLNATSDFQKKC
jgi:hypothetical protein